MVTSEVIVQTVLIGIGATSVMDGWLLILQRVGISTTSFAMVGRWVGHMAHGQVAHAAISKSPPIASELALGWLVHYAIGIAYAAMLVVLLGSDWVKQPTAVPAIAFGCVTVIAAWFVMQPAMGAGVAASKTPAPLKNSLRNLANHAVFGLGLYVAAVLVHVLMPNL